MDCMMETSWENELAMQMDWSMATSKEWYRRWPCARRIDGLIDGDIVRFRLGELVGDRDSDRVGYAVGDTDGPYEGELDGVTLGDPVDELWVGKQLGDMEGTLSGIQKVMQWSAIQTVIQWVICWWHWRWHRWWRCWWIRNSGWPTWIGWWWHREWKTGDEVIGLVVGLDVVGLTEGDDVKGDIVGCPVTTERNVGFLDGDIVGVTVGWWLGDAWRDIPDDGMDSEMVISMVIGDTDGRTRYSRTRCDLWHRWTCAWQIYTDAWHEM